MSVNHNLYLGIDGGIITTGWATMLTGEVLKDFGFLRPDTTGTPNFQRIQELCAALAVLLDTHKPGTIVLEWNSGKVNKNRHKGGGSGLAVNGACIASLWRDSVWWARRMGAKVIVVPETKWTHGKPKPERALAMRAMFPAYARIMESDRGGDIADSIGVLVYYQREERLRG